MRFSWTSLLLAPLLVPVIFSTMLAVFVGGDWWRPFLTMLVLGCIVSYGATIFLFLPCLFLLSLNHQMTGFKVCLLGLVLGDVVFVSLVLLAWGSAAPDFAHPIRTFLVFLLGWVADPATAVFPLAGLTTAGLYWWLAGRRTSPSVPVQ
jgi:hypothetical protein